MTIECPYKGPGSKHQEYVRSAELFEEICVDPECGPYFALALLADMQYENKDLKGTLAVMKIPTNRRVNNAT